MEAKNADSDTSAYQVIFSVLDELELGSQKSFFKRHVLEDDMLFLMKSEEELRNILTKDLGLPYGPAFKFSRHWFSTFHKQKACGDRSARQNMSTDFNCGEISADEKGDALVVSNEDYLTMADNKGRSNVGDELKEISLNEKDVVTQSSIKESTGLVSSQNEGKKKKKKKASKGTESALNDAKGEEVKIEDHGPSGVEDDVCFRGISVGGKTAAVLTGKDPLAMSDNNDNYEDRSSADDGPTVKVDVDTIHGEDESKPSNAECISQNNRKKKTKKKASQGTENAENNTEEKGTKNEDQTSSGVICCRSQLTLQILHSSIAEEVASSKDDIDQAKTSSEKQSLVVTTESHSRVLSTEKPYSISCFTKTPTGNDKETCSSENDQQEVSSDTSAFKGSSKQNVASSSLDYGNDGSEEQKRKSEDKYLTIGGKDQENEFTKIARCNPRPRGLTGKDIFYEKGSVLDAEENRELEFKSLVSAQLCSLRWKIMEKAKTFICACLNNDRKGIIYFGIGDSQEQGSKYKHGEILGLEVEDIKDEIIQAFQSVLNDHIKSNVGSLQKGGEQNCINIHFVPVKNQGNRTNLYVIEIEVTREWRFCKHNVYYTKVWTEKRGADKDCAGKKRLDNYYKVKDEFDDVVIRTNGASSRVKHHDVDKHVKKPLEIKYKDWRRKEKHGCNEIPEDLSLDDGDAKRLRERLHDLNYKDYGFLLIANKLPAQYRGTPNFSFLQNIPWVAVFDLFDPSSRQDGLHHACNETTDAPRAKVKTLDDFKDATDKDTLLSTRGTTWILSNEEMQKGDWITCSKDCLYRALSAYKECFLPGRLVCVFLCFDQTAIEEMTDIMESSFSILGNSASSCVTIVSESKPVVEVFINTSKLSLRKKLRECSITGIPWVFLKEIVRDMVGPSKFEETGATTELPYFKGQYKEVFNKTVNSWYDLEVYSPNPPLPKFAETIEKERDAFYMGAQASQINLLQDHSIPRTLEKEVNTKVEQALKSLSNENIDANHMKTITLPYEPGSGATTLCRRILWNTRTDYRCAVVKAITPSTGHQIDGLQRIGYGKENSKYSLPVLVLVDNFPEKDVRLLTEQIRERQTKCVVLATQPIAKSATNTKPGITPLGKLDKLERARVLNILAIMTHDKKKRKKVEQVLEREKKFIWFGLELFGKEYKEIETRIQNYIQNILMAFLGDSQRMHRRTLEICCFLNKYSNGSVILPHAVVLDSLHETTFVAKQRRPRIQDVHEDFGGLLVEEQNETDGHYGWRPAHSLVSEVVISGIILENTAIRTLEVCRGKTHATESLRGRVFPLFLDRKRISDPVFVEEQETDDGGVVTDLESEVFGSYGKQTKYSPVIKDILEKESNIHGALNVLVTICEQATQTEGKAYGWQQMARFMGYEMRSNEMDEKDELHERLYNAMRKENPIKLSMPRIGIDAAHIAVDIAISCQPSYVNHYTTKGFLYVHQLRNFQPPLLPSLPEAIEICRKALGVYDKALQNSREPNHFSMIGKIQAIVSLLQIIKDLPCFQFEDRKFTTYLKKGDAPPEMKEVLSLNDQKYMQGLCSSTLDLLNELFGNVKLKQTTTYDEKEIRDLNNARIRASNLRRKFYELTGFDKKELTTKEYSVAQFSSRNQEFALCQQKVHDILFSKDETPYSAWSSLTDADVSYIYKLLKPICLSGRGTHYDMLICSKACLQLENRPPVDELDKIVNNWVEKSPKSEWAHLFYYMIHFPIPNGSLAPNNADTKASVNKCASIVREKAGSGFRKSGAEYFLGKGVGLNAILSSQEFRWLETKWETKTEFWRGKEPSERLERVQGQKDGKGIISYKGIQLHFDDALYPNESKDDLWFYVGFTVAGPYAYDPVDNDTYATLQRQTTSSTSLPTAYFSPERSNDTEKWSTPSRYVGRSKTQQARNSSEAPRDWRFNRHHYVKENSRGSPPTRHYARSSTRLPEDDRVSEWGSPTSSSSTSENHSTSSWRSPTSAPRTDTTTDGWKPCKWRIEAEASTKKQENWKKVEGTQGHKRRNFDPRYVSQDGKLHHGAFVLGTRKSQECQCHTNTTTAEIDVTDRCNFAHGWRGDTLQHVCTKCTDEKLTYCQEKTGHEQFIWNLGPYYNSSGDIWKDYKSSRSEWGESS